VFGGQEVNRFWWFGHVAISMATLPPESCSLRVNTISCGGDIVFTTLCEHNMLIPDSCRYATRASDLKITRPGLAGATAYVSGDL